MSSNFDPKSFRKLVSAIPQVTYDELDTSPTHLAVKFVSILDEILEDGWRHHQGHLRSLAPPVSWAGFDRSFSVHLNAWEPLTYLLKGSCTVEDPARCARYFKASFDFAWDWLITFQSSVIEEDPSLLLEKQKTETDGFAWYDMAVGQRIYRLAYILDTVCRDSDYSDDTVDYLYKCLQFHHRLLSIDEFFKAHSNHGLYQTLGQLAASKRFAHVDSSSFTYFELATHRLSELISHHFTSDSIHKEHSPGYHFMVLGSLIGAQQTALITDQAIISRVWEMEDALTSMINPNFCLATIGDTDPRHMVRTVTRAARYETPTLQSLVSNGQIGVFPEPGVRGYLNGGYAFARLYGGDVEPKFSNASYLAQTAAFHSRVHKHADHLAFIWFDKGRDILIDPGRYAYAGRTEIGSDLFNQGFWYSDPKRIYCESTRAHNTVEIDGKSFPRAKVKPFGSALVFAGEVDGCAVTYCEAMHFRSVRHNRQLVMSPGHILLVLDWLYDRTGVAHEYRQNFHFAPEWEVVGKDGMIWGRHPGSDSVDPLDIRVVSLIPEAIVGPVIRGQEEPELIGWISDAANSLIPTSCFDVSQSSSGQCSFATLFVFGQSLEIDWAATRFNRTLSSGKIAWQDVRGKHVLSVSKPVRPVQTDLAK